MKIFRAGSQNSVNGQEEYFTGRVRIDPIHNPSEPSNLTTALVTFEPSARTVWHTHPLGQTLFVTSGAGWVQGENCLKKEIYPGDVVYFEPNEKHWHGATEKTAMSHIAIQEKQNGTPVEWMDAVTDHQYGT